MSKYYQRWKAEGKCTNCGGVRSADDGLECSKCHHKRINNPKRLAGYRAYNESHRKERRAYDNKRYRQVRAGLQSKAKNNKGGVKAPITVSFFVTPGVKQRFYASFRRAARGCWEWKLATSQRGYGLIKIEGYQWGAHRASWVIHRGPIPRGKWILHKRECTNPLCVNPEHLYVGGAKENAVDRSQVGQKHFKLTVKQVEKIRSDRRSSRIVAKEYGVSRHHILSIRSFRKWRSV